jgi:phage terminase small subunit
MALTAKQRAFVAAYCATWNASEAARRAGYRGKRPDQAGYDYLRKPEIAAEIERRITEIMPAGEVISRLAARARATIADVLALTTADNAASWRLDLVKAQATGAIHQIRKIKSGKYGDEVEVYDGLPALELLGKRLKLFGDDTTLKHIDLSKLTPEQLQRLSDGDDLIAILLDTITTPGAS